MLIFQTVAQEESMYNKAPTIGRYVVDFVTAIRATVVSLEMYPPGSKTIANAVEKVSGHLQHVLEQKPTLTLAEVNNLLLIDAEPLDERERKKTPIIDFTVALIERGIQSITFTRETTPGELIEFLVLISKKPKEFKELGNLQELLASKNIKGITLNSRIYLATSQEEIEEQKRQEALLNRLLMQNDGAELRPEDHDILEDALRNRERLNSALSKLGTDIDADVDARIRDPYEAIVEKARRLGEVLNRGFTLMNELDDEHLRDNFMDGLVTMLSEKEPAVLEHLFYEERLEPSIISEMNIEPPLFLEMSEPRVMSYTDAIFEELREVRENFSVFEPEERQGHVDAIRGMVKSLVQNTMNREFFPSVIDLLEDAGLIKPEAASQLLEQAQGVAKVQETVRQVNLTNTDGTVDHDSLDFAIEQFETLSNEALNSVLTGFLDIMGEVMMHPKLSLLVEKLAARMDNEVDFSAVYKACADFAERLTKELIFNELYPAADRLLQLFAAHAAPEPPRHLEQRRRAILAQETIASEDVTRLLVTVYQHGEALAQQQVGQMMLKMGPRMVGVLFDLLKTTEDRKLRRGLLDLLKGLGPGLLTIIQEELPKGDNPWYLTRNLLVLIQDVGNDAHAEWVLPFLSHSDVRVRKEAAKTLMTIDPAGARDMLRRQLYDKDLSIKRHAIASLGQMKDAESIGVLSAMITKRTIAQVEEEEEVQVDAVAALGRMGEATVIPYLIEVLRKEGMFSKLRTKTPTIRARACFALASFKSPEVIAELKRAAKDGQTAVADAAKTVLNSWGI